MEVALRSLSLLVGICRRLPPILENSKYGENSIKQSIFFKNKIDIMNQINLNTSLPISLCKKIMQFNPAGQ